MKKDELIEILNSIEGNPEIIMSSDPEGNSFSPLVEYTYPAKWQEETKIEERQVFSGEELEEYEIPETAVDAVIIWPRN
jgi:hypothetical protein